MFYSSKKSKGTQTEHSGEKPFERDERGNCFTQMKTFPSLAVFKSKQKTYLFKCAFNLHIN